MDWSLCYGIHSKVKDLELKTIKDIKKSGLDIIPATVPGHFQMDYINAGKLDGINSKDDLYFGTNILKIQELESTHVWYFTEINIKNDNEYLHFGGIDTIGEIYINGNFALKADNMFLEYDVKDFLKKGRNEVVVHIIPACIESRKYPIGPVERSFKSAYPGVHLRKAAHSFGWDIMPRVVTSGLWKNVEIRKEKEECIIDTYFCMGNIDYKTNNAGFSCKVNVKAERDFMKGYTVRVSGKCGDSEFSHEEDLWHTSQQVFVNVENAKLWWPRFAGEPNVYDVTTELKYNGEVIDSKTENLGLRIISLENTEVVDENGNGDFCFVVNGKRIFALGTNWVPLDAFHADDEDRLDKALELLKDANCNMVRCWGGNVYENDKFYDFCDRNGIMIWQDFSFACAIYPNSDEFKNNVKRELEFQVKRLRNHPSLMLWSGDNEGDMIYAYLNANRADPNKNRLTREVITEVVDYLDPETPFLPSSPYISPLAFKTKLPTTEDHLWSAVPLKDSFYKDSPAKFLSEIGKIGYTGMSSLNKFLEKPETAYREDNSVTDEYIAHGTLAFIDRTHPLARTIDKAFNDVKYMFGGISDNFETFIKQSQIVQAEAYKYFIERMRIRKGDKTGILWWNLIDGWPQISYSVIDYYFAKKLSYHYIKRAQEPVCLMFDEPKDGELSLFGVNEFMEEKRISYKIKDLYTGQIIFRGNAVLGANQSQNLGSLEIDPEYKTVYLIEWNIDGEKYSNHYTLGVENADFEKYMTAILSCGYDQFAE